MIQVCRVALGPWEGHYGTNLHLTKIVNIMPSIHFNPSIFKPKKKLLKTSFYSAEISLFSQYFLYYRIPHFSNLCLSTYASAPPGWLSSEHVGLMTWWYEFDPWLRQTFFLVYFHLSPLLKHVRKVVSGFGKKSCVSIGVIKPRNRCASPTATI